MFSKNSQLLRIHYYFFVSIYSSHSDRRIFLTFTQFIFLTPNFQKSKNFSPQYSLTHKPEPRNSQTLPHSNPNPTPHETRTSKLKKATRVHCVLHLLLCTINTKQ